MKNIVFIVIILIIFTGCNQEKIAQLEFTVEQLNSKISLLESKNNELNNEIKQLKETDQYYYQSGVDEFSNGNFQEAIRWMNRLKTKFPTSSLLSSADTLIKKSNIQITAIYTKDKADLNQLIRDVAKLDIEEAIRRLDAYIKGSHSTDLLQTATNSLNQYKKEYEETRTIRELEQSVGVRLVDYVTGWGNVNDFGSEMYVPRMMLKFENISGRALSDTIQIKTNFVRIQKNEIFGDSSDNLLYSFDTPLQAGFSKTIFVDCGRGYRGTLSYYDLSDLPSLEAHIYINDKFYRKFTIQKKFRGNL